MPRGAENRSQTSPAVLARLHIRPVVALRWQYESGHPVTTGDP
ncbi:hypothetical protein AmDm5_1988 [Acetobacter malorum]|nr:hypothetical protein AmDm5_1988 [Acetobacter malorum]